MCKSFDYATLATCTEVKPGGPGGEGGGLVGEGGERVVPVAAGTGGGFLGGGVASMAACTAWLSICMMCMHCVMHLQPQSTACPDMLPHMLHDQLACHHSSGHCSGYQHNAFAS